MRTNVATAPSGTLTLLLNTDRPYRPGGTVIVEYIDWSMKPSRSFWSSSWFLPDKNNDRADTIFLILSFTAFSPLLPLAPPPKL